MKTPSIWKKPLYSALVFFGTLIMLSVWYAAYQTINSSEYAGGQQLTSTLFGKVISNLADHENRITSLQSTGWIPTGAVMAFYGTGCPNGWAPADGTANGVKKTDGTSATLDLRGEFIRGLDVAGVGARNIDAGRALGSSQADEIKSHSHAGIDRFLSGPANGWYLDPYTFNDYYWGASQPLTATSTSNYGGSETRPRNIALLYCVKN